MNSDAKLMKQIVIEEGLFAPGYKSYDCSVLHFGNFILFYQREETWHKLQMYNVVTNELEELEGYHIQEPIGEDIRYHIMFSKQFGKDYSDGDDVHLNKKDIHDFLKKQFILCQAYKMIKKREDTPDYVCLPYSIFKVGDYKNALN